LTLAIVFWASGCGSAARPATTATTHVSASVPLIPVGYPTASVTIRRPDGMICQRCMLLADTAPLRARGLMGVTSLGGYDGMVFLYGSPVEESYWMKDTITPLQIAFLDSGGAYLEQFDMAPCTTDPCPTFRPKSPFLMAVETFAGQLSTVGLIPGSTVELGPPCLRTG
jgi:uncharacterized membrane protein (UPF0127 family)